MTKDDTDKDALPAPAQGDAASLVGLLPGSMSPALAIWLDDRLFNRAKLIASYLARAEGFVPAHLVGKLEVCFAVVSRALVWKLDPYAVAQATYEKPGGGLGYYGSLCHAILENSGRLTDGIEYEHFGDWDKVQARFDIRTSQKSGKPYPVAAWKPEDENGLGVIVRAQLKGENRKREYPFLLKQAFPRNSTLWATDPMTQIQYTAVRRFGTSIVPHLFMGVPFDREDLEPVYIGPDAAKDITPPRPRRSDFAGREPTADVDATQEADAASDPETQTDADVVYDLYDEVGEMRGSFAPGRFMDGFRDMLYRRGLAQPQRRQLVENNIDVIRSFYDERKLATAWEDFEAEMRREGLIGGSEPSDQPDKGAPEQAETRADPALEQQDEAAAPEPDDDDAFIESVEAMLDACRSVADVDKAANRIAARLADCDPPTTALVQTKIKTRRAELAKPRPKP